MCDSSLTNPFWEDHPTCNPDKLDVLIESVHTAEHVRMHRTANAGEWAAPMCARDFFFILPSFFHSLIGNSDLEHPMV